MRDEAVLFIISFDNFVLFHYDNYNKIMLIIQINKILIIDN